jgi:ADP-heptose:LPS heptosyltransferase
MKLTTMRHVDYFVGVPVCFILSGLVRLWTMLRGPRPIEEPRSVLFIELSEMGSTILASSAIQRARERYRGGRHGFVIFGKNAPSLRLLGIFEESEICTIRDDSLAHMAADFLKFIRFCRERRFDVVIDLELFSRISSILSLISGAPIRVGFDNYRGEGLYRGDHLTHGVHYNPYHHMGQNFMALIDALDGDPDVIPKPKRAIPVPPLTVQVGTEPEAFDFVRRALLAGGPVAQARRVVVVNHDAGSLLPIRSWPVDRYIELIRRLLALEPTLVVVLMGIGESLASAEGIAAAVGNPRCLNFVGKTRSLVDVIQLFHQADLLITNDSGPAHFASLTPIASITLFGPETPVLYGPLGARAVHLFAGLACSPCLSALNHRNSPCTDNVCLQVIAVDEVFEHARRLLDAAPPRAAQL